MISELQTMRQRAHKTGTIDLWDQIDGTLFSYKSADPVSTIGLACEYRLAGGIPSKKQSTQALGNKST